MWGYSRRKAIPTAKRNSADNAGMPASIAKFPAKLTARISASRVAAFTLLLLTAAAAFAQAVRLPGATPVGTPVTQTISIALPVGGTLTSIKTLTQGSPAFDFAATTGGTCTPGITYLPGQQCTVALTFTPTAPGERRGAIVLLGPVNLPLATQLVVASATGGVATFVPGTISTVAGNEAWIYGGDGNAATASSIFLPFGIAVDAAGDLFIADSSNSRIRRVDGKTGIISTIAGTGVIGFSGDGGLATIATLSSPSSIALDPAGNLFFTDSGNNLIRRIDAFTGLITTVAGLPGTHGYTGDLGPAIAATLNNPNGIAFDSAGNLYLADTANHAIRKISPAGIISSVAGRGFPAFSGDGGPAVSAGLNSPWSVTPAPAGGLYIADQNNNRIRFIDASGTISTVIGTGDAAYGGDNGPAPQAQLNVPASVAIDVAGNLYIADSGNNRVRKISAKTNIVTTIAGNSGESISGDSGPADQAGLYGPYTLALDNQGSLLIADVFHNRIRKVAANAATLQFKPMRVGRIASPLAQTLENDGNAPLTLGTLVPTSQSQLDPNGTTCDPAAPLSPEAQCLLSLQFAPTVTGNPVDGLFTANSDAANSPSVVTLTGQVLDVDPASVAVTSSVNPSTTGSPITFSVTVSSGGSTPTGQVTLLDANIPLGTAQLAAGGLASFTTSTLTSGQHTITVAYAGDTSNSSAVSSPVLQLVKDVQAATTTLIASSASPAIAGSSLQLTASVAVSTAGSGTGTISGTVAFVEGPNTLGTADIVNGNATLSLTTLDAGTHAILAVYSGDAHYAQSTSAPLREVIQTATTKLALSTSASPSFAGASLTLTATILSNGGIPTGPVAFLDAGKPLGSAPLNAQGIATLTVAGPAWTPGAHILTAVYAGDTWNQPSTSAPIAQTIVLADSAATLTANPLSSPLGGSATLTAILTSKGGTPTGTVQFLDGSLSLGLANLDPQGTATFSTSTLTLGAHILTVVYPGDSYDGPATSKPVAITIIPTNDAVSVSPSNDPAIVSTPVAFTIALTGTGVTPTGTVTLVEGTTTLGSATLDPTGKTVITVSSLTIGAHTLAAVYAGDTTHAPATSAALIERILQSTTLALAAPAHVIAGTPLTVSATLSGDSGKPVTGNITLAEGPTPLGTLAPDATGHATWTSAQLAVGPHTLTATYAGDPLSAPANASTTSITVDIASTVTTIATTLNPAPAGSPITLTAQVSGSGAIPTGSVTFRDSGAILSTVNLTGNTAALTLATLAPGIHQLSAAYTGDTFDSPSNSTALAQQVARQTTITLASSANPSLLTDTIAITIGAANGTPIPPGGAVTLTDGAQTLATLTLSNGAATYTYPAPALGAHTLVATYAGDPENGPASSQPLVQTVTLRPSTTTFTPSSTALANGQQLILISVVQGSGPNPPSGSVTFTSGSQTLGTAQVTPGGIATLTLTPAAGSYNVTAAYSGDTLFAPSAAHAVAITVGPPIAFTLTPNPPSLTLRSGDHTTFSLAIDTNPNWADTLALGCAGLPAYATCTFSENQIAVGGGLPHTLTVTLDTGNPLGAGPTAALAPPTSSTSPVAFCVFPAMIFLALFHPRKVQSPPQAGGYTYRPSPFLPLGTPIRRRMLTLLLFAAGALGALGTLTALTGCGTTFTQKATPAGSYTFQVVGTGDKTTATQTVTLQLQVTQ